MFLSNGRDFSLRQKGRRQKSFHLIKAMKPFLTDPTTNVLSRSGQYTSITHTQVYRTTVEMNENADVKLIPPVRGIEKDLIAKQVIS